jgi:Fe2+ or Zn2+ uptake regulation protein
MTKQRDIILEELRNVTTHPNADEIYHMVRNRIPNVSFGTVYRNLRILKELGEILELDYGKSSSRFDGNPDNHYHFACDVCGSIYDLNVPIKAELDEELSSKTGFKITRHRTEFYGICPNCSSEAK